MLEGATEGLTGSAPARGAAAQVFGLDDESFVLLVLDDRSFMGAVQLGLSFRVVLRGAPNDASIPCGSGFGLRQLLC